MTVRLFQICVLSAGLLLADDCHAAGKLSELANAALSRAGKNRPQIVAGLRKVPAKQREGMQFLIAHMPDRDLKTLSADYLLENVRLAYRAWNDAPWKKRIPKEVFLNNVLPYASINERRDNWRKDFLVKFRPLIEQARTPAEAAAILNRKVFPLLKVRYSTRRPKADQSPLESMKAGTASCTGLAVILVDVYVVMNCYLMLCSAL